MTQQRFWRHENQRLAEGAVNLPAQNMEVIGRGGAIGDNPIVVAAHLQKALEAG